MNSIGDDNSANSSVAGRWPSLLRNVLGFCLFAVAYYFAYRYGMAFSHVSASPFWFPDSVLLCALLLSRPGKWWVFVVAILPIRLFTQVAHDIPLWFLLITFTIDAAKGILIAAALRRFLKNPVRLETVQEFGLFCFFAVLLIPAASAIAGAGARHARGADYWVAWEQWFMGNALAHLVITPAILYWVFGFSRKMQMPSAKRCVEGALLTIGLIVTGYIAFRTGPGGTGFAESQFFAPVPFLFWAAVRFGMFGASGAILVIAFLSVEAALAGRGYFSGQTPADTALALQHFLMLRAAPLYLVAILIEQRKQDERSLRASEERYREVVESQTELICRYLPDTTITFVNEAYCRFFGKRREELIGRKFIELIPTSAHETALKQVADVVQGLRPYPLEHQVILPDGSVGWHQWTDSAVPSTDGQVKELQGIGRDITDRKRAEEARLTLAHASRLAVVGEFTAMIAHELNQPLGAILSNAEAAEMLLDLQTAPVDKIREILADIRKDDLRASDAIRRIRALLQKREMEIQSLDLNETVSDVLQLASGDTLRRRVQIHKDLGASLPAVRGDKVYLQQVLLNLILNGMDAMNGNPEAERHLFLSTTYNGNGIVEVAIKDVGHGIAPENLSRVFDSFFTTKRDGMGLGLSIARSIVQLHSGQLWAENNPAGGGATFRFTLPVDSAMSLQNYNAEARHAEGGGL